MNTHAQTVDQLKRGLWARGLMGLAALWLLVSVFLWPHDRVSSGNGLVVSIGTMLCCIWALRTPFARWVSGALGLWLVAVSWFTWQVNTLTTWNNVLVGLAIVGLSAVGDAVNQRG